MSKKVLILFSGGADSLYMLVLAQRMNAQIGLILFRYGQKHEEEIEYALNSIDKFMWDGAAIPKAIEVDLRKCFQHTTSNLLKDRPWSRINYEDPTIESFRRPLRSDPVFGRHKGPVHIMRKSPLSCDDPLDVLRWSSVVLSQQVSH